MDKFIKEITKEAGNAIFKKFGKVGVKYTKEDAADVVTEADLISNKIITDAIKKKYPKHAIISEETGEENMGAEYCWIIDPLDGTRNFATKTPMFGTMVGLARNGKMELAAIYNPCTKEFFFAQKGKGAFCNGKRVHCSQHKTWKDSWGLCSVRMSKDTIEILEKIQKHSKKESCWISAFGSSAVGTLYQADGRRDWRVSKGGGVWDYAAPSLILQEAGCTVTNFKGAPWSLKDKGFIVANKYLHSTLFKIVTG